MIYYNNKNLITWCFPSLTTFGGKANMYAHTHQSAAHVLSTGILSINVGHRFAAFRSEQHKPLATYHRNMPDIHTHTYKKT